LVLEKILILIMKKIEIIDHLIVHIGRRI